MDIVKNKTKLYEKIIPLFTDYIDKISNTHKTIYAVVAEARSYIDRVYGGVGFLQNANLDTPEDVFKTMREANNVNDYLLHVYNLLQFDTTHLHTEMSNTYMLGLEDQLRELSVQYAIIKNDIIHYDSGLIHKVLDSINNEPLELVHALFVKYQNTINLYSHYLQNKLNTSEKSSSVHQQALTFLEEAKDIIISNADIAGKLNYYPQTRIQGYGLVPAWQHLDESALLRQALSIVKYNAETVGGGKILADISRIFLEKRIGLYLILSISPNPIEFNNTSITNRKKLDTWNIPENSGLSPDVLEKFDVIKNISEFEKPRYEKVLLGDTSSDEWLVVRTLNGKHYDIMAKNKNKVLVNRRFVNKMNRGTSVLIDTYNRICAEKLKPFLKVPSEVTLEYNTTTSLNIVVNSVTRQILEYIDQQLEKRVPSNLKELFAIISDQISTIVGRIIIESYENESKLHDNAGFSTELSPTFLTNAEYIINAFINSVNELIAKSDMNESMFKTYTKSALVVHIRTRISDIIRISAEKEFDPRNDIYEKLMIKKKLLNIELQST
jgi:hypothetical protein